MCLEFELDLTRAFLQALDKECIKKNKLLKLVIVVPRTLFNNFKEQKIVLRAGKDGKTVKCGRQTILKANFAQWVMAVAFESTTGIIGGNLFPGKKQSKIAAIILL